MFDHEKLILASLNPIFLGEGCEYWNAINCSHVKRQTLWRHISKNRTANFLEFRIFNPIYTGLFGWCNTGEVFHLHPLTPLPLKFVQNYFEERSIFCDKKIGIRALMTSLWRHLCSNEYRKLLKTAYFKVTAASSSSIQSYWNLAETFNTVLQI